MTVQDLIESTYYHVVLGQSKASAVKDLRLFATAILGWYEELGAVEPPTPAPPMIADQLELVP